MRVPTVRIQINGSDGVSRRWWCLQCWAVRMMVFAYDEDEGVDGVRRRERGRR